MAIRAQGRKKSTSRRKEAPKRENKLSELKHSMVEDLVLHLLDKFSREIEKASVSDLVKLMQLNEGMEEDRPREVTVQWVEPEELRQ